MEDCWDKLVRASEQGGWDRPTLPGQSSCSNKYPFHGKFWVFCYCLGNFDLQSCHKVFLNSQTINIVHCIIHHFIINFKLGGFHFSCLTLNPSYFHLLPVQTKFSIYPTLFYLSLPIKASILNIYFACKKRRSCLLFCLWWNKMDNQEVTN